MPTSKLRTSPHTKLREAFEDYIAAKPWLHLKDYHALALTDPADQTPFYAVAMGDGGQQYGVSLYMGEDAFQDLAAILTGQRDHNTLAPMLGAMTDSPLDPKPVMFSHRVNPTPTMAAYLTRTLLPPLLKVSTSDKIALTHAFRAATDLARTAGTPDSPVKPREGPTSLHIITASLEDTDWHYKLETGVIRFKE